MQYGYFDDAHREYIITNPKTPVRWINYIGTLGFGGFVDHTGGGVICRGDPALDRITKYIPQLPASQFNGETLYLRLKEPAGNRIFSPYFVPTLDPFERYECHVGLGYTRIVSEFYGIRSDVTIFVPLAHPRVLRDIKITNLRREPVELDAIPVVEYSHPDALKQLTNADWVPQTMQSVCHTTPEGFTILIQYPFMHRDTQINFFTSNYPASSFETDRRRFLGDNEYGTWSNPQSLQAAELSNHEAHRGDNLAALLHRLGVLHSGETRRLITQLGQAERIADELESIRQFTDPQEVDQALADQARFWDRYLSRQQVATPDPDANRMLNIHNPRQCYITKQWSRYLSLYQLGYGARGIGFRDGAQDTMGIMANAPEQARGLVEQLLRVQKPDGSAMHQFNPQTMVATAGDARERPDLPQYYSDDHLWIILAITSFLKEKGDLTFLDGVIPYYDSAERGSVLDHMQRAIEFTRHDVGPYGLPLLGFADWNDTVNLARGAESLFTANLYGKAMLELIDLAEFMRDVKTAVRYRAYYDEMKARFNGCAWDGEWFLRYFDADGTPLGSRRNEHGQIYINAQSWPVISGFASPEQGRMALEAVYHRLNTRHGIKLSSPGFNGFDPHRGGITTYPPGAKENGGIFLHTNPWVMIAETLLGNGDRAFEYYQKINPAAQNDRIEEFECEPYAYPQNILGDEHPQFGLARNSWLTGTAAWVYQAATKHILGIQPAYDALVVDPCIPRHWDVFHVKRAFRNAVYEIAVTNPQHVNGGIASVEVDGCRMPNARLQVFGDGQAHRVQVVLGGKR